MGTDPVLIAYGVKKSSDGKRNHWRRIGEAFPHVDGAGLTVMLDAFPPDGRVILLELDARDHMRVLSEQLRKRTDIKRKVGSKKSCKMRS